MSQIEFDLVLACQNTLTLNIDDGNRRDAIEKDLERVEASGERIVLGELVQVEPIVELAPKARIGINELIELLVDGSQAQY